MKPLSTDFWKRFYMVFEKALDTECEYKSMCSAYQGSSSTCTDEVERSFCGFYKTFLKQSDVVLPKLP